jgi:hypothetical protein
MNIFNKPADLLKFWQEVHGELDEKWKSVFLKDSNVKEILKHPNDRIAVAIRRKVKLVDILEDLYDQDSKQAEFKLKQNPYHHSIPDQPGRGTIEKREIEGNRFGRQF